MKKVAAWAASAALSLSLAGCAAQTAPPPASSVSEVPRGALSGVVLDVTKDSLILRTPAGEEYVFKLDGDEIPEGQEVLNGSYVEVQYTGLLQGLGGNVNVVRVEKSEAQTLGEEHTNSLARGRVVSFQEDGVTLRTETGEEYVFNLSQALQRVQGGIREDLCLQLLFDGSKADLSLAMVKRAEEAALAPDTYQFSAKVNRYDPGRDTLSFTTKGGRKYEASLKEAEVLVDGGFRGGETVTVFYQWAQEAQKDGSRDIRVLRVADAASAGVPQLYGVVESYDENRGKLVVHTLDGRVLTAWISASQAPEKGLDKNDGLLMTYSGWIEGSSMKNARITSIETEGKGLANESVLLGTVESLPEGGLILKAQDGRTLEFTETSSANSIPAAIQKGDRVCVSFTGWLGSEEDGCDTQHAVVTHVAYALY